MARPRKVHSDLLDKLLGPVDPVEYERVRRTRDVLTGPGRTNAQLTTAICILIALFWMCVVAASNMPWG